MKKIKKSLKLLSYNDTYECADIQVTIKENDFTFECCTQDGYPDGLKLEGADSSLENFDDMYFAIDGEFKSLRDIYDLLDGDIVQLITYEQREYEIEHAIRQSDNAYYLHGRL